MKHPHVPEQSPAAAEATSHEKPVVIIFLNEAKIEHSSILLRNPVAGVENAWMFSLLKSAPTSVS
jgi:hypothetical protein